MRSDAAMPDHGIGVGGMSRCGQWRLHAGRRRSQVSRRRIRQKLGDGLGRSWRRIDGLGNIEMTLSDGWVGWRGACMAAM